MFDLLSHLKLYDTNEKKAYPEVIRSVVPI